MGVGAILVQINSVTLLQRSAENEVLGRVFAVLGSLILGALAIGSLVAPGIVNWLGSARRARSQRALRSRPARAALAGLRRIDAEAVIAEEPLELLRRIEIFAELPEPVLERLGGRAQRRSRSLRTGVVVSRGEVGNHFYAIASGKAVVELDDGTTRELGPGDFFGEIALLRDVPRTATVRALEPLRLFAIERDEFLAAVTGHEPTLAARRERRGLAPAGRRARRLVSSRRARGRVREGARTPRRGLPPRAAPATRASGARRPSPARAARARRARCSRSSAIAAWFANRPSMSTSESLSLDSVGRSSTESTPSARSSTSSGTAIMLFGT